MAPRLAVYGGSFNPPGIHHRRLVERLVGLFDRIVIRPCGLRRDKLTNNGVEPFHRATLTDLAFAGLSGVEVDHRDLEQDVFTPTWQLQEQYADQGDVWHVVGSDLIVGGAQGQAQIQHWQRGDEVWRSLHFIVIERDGFPIESDDLPPHHQVIRPKFTGSSTDIRSRLFRFEPVASVVTPTVDAYIRRYGLYQGALPRSTPAITFGTPRISFVVDERNARAVTEADHLATITSVDDRHPDLIVVLGGDGTMLRAIRQHWRRRVPFLGLNYGTVGFLLNDLPRGLTPSMLGQPWLIRHAPLLYVETTDEDGQVHHDLGFNDAYVDAEAGSAAWIEVSVDDRVVIPRLVGDGALVATAAGSSAYARAMGATPIAIGTPSLVLAGSNVFLPAGWHHAQLDINSAIRLRNVDPTPGHGKRPLLGFIDGLPQGRVAEMTVRTSRVASVELAFQPDHDPRQKLTRLQFAGT